MLGIGWCKCLSWQCHEKVAWAMLADLLLLASALLPPLAARRIWVVLLALAGTASASILMWNAGLKEDVPPVLLTFTAAVLLAIVPVVAVLLFHGKVWCLSRWKKANNLPQ